MTKNLQRFFQIEAAGDATGEHGGDPVLLAAPVEVSVGFLDISKNLLLWVDGVRHLD